MQFNTTELLEILTYGIENKLDKYEKAELINAFLVGAKSHTIAAFCKETGGKVENL